MKNVYKFTILAIFVWSISIDAQIFDKVKQAVKNKTEQKTDETVNKTVDKTSEKNEEGITNIFKKKDK